MKIYNLKKEQLLPITIQEAWDFFSSPTNLGKITPDHMKFKILYQSGGKKAYAGQIIRYKINVLPFIPTHWVTEITQVKEPYHFIDEQRFGPYALWHHQHHFEEVQGGVLMTDEVNYAIPFGLLGRFAHWIFVAKEVNRIFEYRFKRLEDFFSKGQLNTIN